uniref:Uncharacterized protein n=1 Tax=Moniliophthora roreri TaxID=221103 RepID=A0A0W0FJJ6_MONRR
MSELLGVSFASPSSQIPSGYSTIDALRRQSMHSAS